MRVDGGDSLPADDRFLFSVERRDPGKVGFIDSGVKRGQLYFRAALDASPDAEFQVEAMHPELAAGQTLANYKFLVLNEPGQLTPGLEDALKRYVNGGGSLLISLGPASAALPKSAGDRRSHRRLNLRSTRSRFIPFRL